MTKNLGAGFLFRTIDHSDIINQLVSLRVQILHCVVPSLPPQDIKLQNSSSTSIFVQWKPIPKHNVHGKLLGIKLLYRSAPRDNSIVFRSHARRSIVSDWSVYTDITLPPNALSYNITSLEKFTNYSVEILGFTSKGDGNVSHRFIVSTDEDGQYGNYLCSSSCYLHFPYLIRLK